jgi:hypothetical protein
MLAHIELRKIEMVRASQQHKFGQRTIAECKCIGLIRFS